MGFAACCWREEGKPRNRIVAAVDERVHELPRALQPGNWRNSQLLNPPFNSFTPSMTAIFQASSECESPFDALVMVQVRNNQAKEKHRVPDHVCERIAARFGQANVRKCALHSGIESEVQPAPQHDGKHNSCACPVNDFIFLHRVAGETIPASKLPKVVVFVVIIHLLAEKLSPCIGDVAAACLVTNPFGTAVALAKRCGEGPDRGNCGGRLGQFPFELLELSERLLSGGTQSL
jgi:hypothetical protein